MNLGGNENVTDDDAFQQMGAIEEGPDNSKSNDVLASMLGDVARTGELAKLSPEQIKLANSVVRRLHPLCDLNLSEVIPFVGWLLRKCGCRTDTLDGAFSRVQRSFAADSRVDDLEAEDRDVDYD